MFRFMNTSVSYGGDFVNEIIKAMLEVFVLLLKNFSFLYIKSIHFSTAEKACNKTEI